MNQVLVNRDCLEEYLRKEYPGFQVISSTTKRMLDFVKDSYIYFLVKDDAHDFIRGKMDEILASWMKPQNPVRR